MKVVYIIDFPIDGNSGKNKATREKARVLKEKVGSYNFIFLNNKRSRNVIFKVFLYLFFDLRALFTILPIKGKFIVVQRVLFLPFTRLLLFFKNATVVSEFHADFKDEIPHLGKDKFVQYVLKLLVPAFNLNYKLSHGIIYNHPNLKEKFDKVFKCPSIFSYNGANIKEFYPESKLENRNKLNISEDDIVFLFLGSVSKWHGVDYIIELFNDEKLRSLTNVYLYIVGAKTNSNTEALIRSIKNNNIKIIPPVDVDTAKVYINMSDYCLLPVKQIRISPGSPLKLYDYISCGKPVIAQSNIRGYSDEVLNYSLGYVLDFTDPIEAAFDMLKIISLREDFSENNRNMALSSLSWESRIDKWLIFFQTFN